MKKRTGLADRKLPNYTKGEETFNMVSHIVGGGMGIVILFVCTIVAAWNHNVWGLVSGIIYGITVIILYSMSSIYHGLTLEMPKKVFQVIDHCAIYFLIAGTYTPVLLGRFREEFPSTAWTMFGIIWGLAALGVVFNAIDLKRFQLASMALYLGIGWCAVFKIADIAKIYGKNFLLLLIAGGVIYTIGAIFYSLGKKKKFMHGVFHVFVDVATLLHFLGIAIYIMPLV